MALAQALVAVSGWQLTTWIGAFLVGAILTAIAPPISLWARRLQTRRARRQRIQLPSSSAAPYDSEGTSKEVLSASIANIVEDPIRGPRLYVSAVEIDDFRCFDKIRLTLHYPGEASALTLPNVNLILGDNGSGKSTLLKAIAIAALGPILDSSGFAPYRLIRENMKRASITGHFLIDDPDDAPRERLGQVELERVGDYELVKAQHDLETWSRIFDESDPSFLVVGYGVNRRTTDDEIDRASLERRRRLRRYQRVASLFDEGAVLTPLSSWLTELKLSRRAEVDDLLAKLLPRDTTLTGSTPSDAIFRHRGIDVPYRAMSDGYKSFIGWIGDLLFQIDSVAQGNLPFDEVGGIVLVDEVDLLLHPSWQRDVVPKVARAFPKLQFVFTTHSPIVAGTLEPGNILIARETDKGTSRFVRLKASIYGLNAEQILLSSYFEMESTRAPGVQAKLSDLARRAVEGDDAAAREYLAVLAAGRPDAPEGGRDAP